MLLGFVLAAGMILAAAAAVWMIRDALTTGEFIRRGHTYTWADDRFSFELHLFMLGLGALVLAALVRS